MRRRPRAAFLRAIGIAYAIEIAGGPQGAPTEEFLELRFDNSGAVTVLTGLHSHGHVPIAKMRVAGRRTNGDTVAQEFAQHGQ